MEQSVPISRSHTELPPCVPSRVMPSGPWPVVGIRGGGDGSVVVYPADSLPSLGKLHLASTFSLWHRCSLFLVGL